MEKDGYGRRNAIDHDVLVRHLHGETLEQIAKVYGVTVERIRKRERRRMAYLRQWIRQSGVPEDLLGDFYGSIWHLRMFSDELICLSARMQTGDPYTDRRLLQQMAHAIGYPDVAA